VREGCESVKCVRVCVCVCVRERERERERERVKWSRNTSVFISASPLLQLQWPECRGKMMLFIISEKGQKWALTEGGQKERILQRMNPLTLLIFFFRFHLFC